MGEPQAYSIVGQQQPRVHSPRSALLNLTTKTNSELFRCVHILQIKMVITQTRHYSLYRFCWTGRLSVLGNTWPKCDNVTSAGRALRQNAEGKKHKNPTQKHKVKERKEQSSSQVYHGTTKQLLCMHLIFCNVSQTDYP